MFRKQPRLPFVCLLFACLLIAPYRLSAQDITYYGGFTLTSNYVSNGVTQSNDKPALQGYVEMQTNGFYLGTWLSSVDLGTDDVEVDLNIGYRKHFDNDIFFALGYSRYLYNDTGDCCGEAKLWAGYTLWDKLGINGYLAYDPQADTLNKSLTLAYATNDKLGFSATYGESDGAGTEYWDAGLSYVLTDALSADLRYYGAEVGDVGVVLSLTLATQQDSFIRLLATPFTQR
ncbi:TorF family putative porin [Seohaeicola saemankumensis]|nr:TorF family putative porin [Seohaeicola saemankumensis]MCA0872877.1 TorF family putative porin [Seohaeicola saemankumensis]